MTDMRKLINIITESYGNGAREANGLISEGYAEARQVFRQQRPYREDDVDAMLTAFRELVDRNKVQGDERNIDWWRKQGWDRFREFVARKQQEPTKRDIKLARLPGKSIMLAQNDGWWAVIPLDLDAARHLGRGTNWCVSTGDRCGPAWDLYLRVHHAVIIMVISKNDLGPYAVVDLRNDPATHFGDSPKHEIRDEDDRRVSDDEFKKATGFDATRLLALVPGADDPRMEPLLQQNIKTRRWRAWINGPHTRNAEMEARFIRVLSSASARYGGFEWVKKELIIYMSLVREAQGPIEWPEDLARLYARAFGYWGNSPDGVGVKYGGQLINTDPIHVLGREGYDAATKGTGI